MKDNFRSALAHVLRHEGGFVHHPKDPGGATNKGITLATYRRFINPSGSVSDLRKITDAQVAEVYKRQYWDEVSGDILPSGVDYCVFDFAVNSGPSRAIKHLQMAVNVEPDGELGSVTIGATIKADSAETINRICNTRLQFKKRLKTWPTFGKGWSRRVADVRAHALKLAKEGQATPPKPTPTPIAQTASAAPQTGLTLLWEIIAKLFTRKKP